MYRNKWTGALLTDEEYRALREREVVDLWNELSEEKRKEWGCFESFREREFSYWPDGDFEYIGKKVEELLELGMDVLMNHMDDDLREQVHRELAPCSNKEFLIRYMELHREKFDEEFDVN